VPLTSATAADRSVNYGSSSHLI